jgi:phage head maturation protease
MEKVNLSTDNQIQMTMGFSKVDAENRRVRGFATFDNLDRQNDIVLSSASETAFKKFAGNIREMHDSKKAVGRMVSFETTKQFDPATGQTYNGVVVDVYVSKGAQDTWEKVLDGTLTGFSIAGPIIESEPVYDAQIEKTVRVIKQYELNELSLVDTPANQLASVVSIVKMADGSSHIEGMISKTSSSNVFFCEADNITILNKADNNECPVCSSDMTNIGWAESGESENDMIKSLLAKFKSEKLEKNGGTETMAEAVEETVETPVVEKSEDTAEVSEAVENTDVTTEEVEKSETVEETSTEEVTEEISFEKSVTDSISALAEQVSAIAKALETVTSSVIEVTKSVGEVQENLSGQVSVVEELKGVAGDVAKRLDTVEDSTAVKKSAEVGPSADGKIEKSSEEISFWGQRFVSKTNF